MASIASIPSLTCRLTTPSSSSSIPSALCPVNSSVSFTRFAPNVSQRLTNPKFNRIRAVEEETLITEEEAQEMKQVEEEDTSATDQSVSVPVSPSDILTMFFQAEGTMDESIASKVSKSLEEVDGISDLRIRVLEGIASVELKKQTTVQATGVASNLVEIIQGSGFKLQTLNLSFEDEEESTS